MSGEMGAEQLPIPKLTLIFKNDTQKGPIPNHDVRSRESLLECEYPLQHTKHSAILTTQISIKLLLHSAIHLNFEIILYHK